jgi:hypothetical protein
MHNNPLLCTACLSLLSSHPLCLSFILPPSFHQALFVTDQFLFPFTMPMNLSVTVSPRPKSYPRSRKQPHPQPHLPTKTTRNALKRRFTGMFREQTDHMGTSTTIGTIDSSPDPRPLCRSASLSTLRHKVSHQRRAPLNRPMPSTQHNLLPESPPLYTILATAPQDRLVVTHPSPSPSPSTSSGSSNPHAKPWDQLYVPPRTSSIVCRQLRTSPSVAELDEGSHTLIQSLYNEQVRRLVRDREAQEQIDRDLAFAISLQELQDAEAELAGQHSLRSRQSTADKKRRC